METDLLKFNYSCQTKRGISPIVVLKIRRSKKTIIPKIWRWLFQICCDGNSKIKQFEYIFLYTQLLGAADKWADSNANETKIIWQIMGGRQKQTKAICSQIL